jgi:hypothetical protein
MVSTHVIVINIGHATCAKATDVIFAKTADVIATSAGHATPTEITHMTSTQATHLASAEAAHTATMSSTPSATAACLCTRGKKAAGKHCACQNHHYSSSHDILHLRWADCPPQVQSDVGLSQQRGPTSRWTRDGNADLSSLLNSHSSALDRRGCSSSWLAH